MQGRIKKMPVEERVSLKLIIQKHIEKMHRTTLGKQWGYETVFSGSKLRAEPKEVTGFKQLVSRNMELHTIRDLIPDTE